MNAPQVAEAVALSAADQLAGDGAPVVLISGVLGAGKTLFALSRYAKGKAGVYVKNIPGCALPKCDPTTWATPGTQDDRASWTVPPPGSTWIVDEVRDVYPPKSPSSEPPAYYKLHLARQAGVVIVLICQHPNDIDARVRRLVGLHFHVVRVPGKEESQIHEFHGKVGDVDSAADMAESISFRWQYDKEVFGLYKSAAQHRTSTKVPWKYRAGKWYLGIAAVVAVCSIAWVGLRFVRPVSSGAVSLAAGQSSGLAAGGGPRSQVAAGSGDREHVATPEEYMAERKPRINGLPDSAPRYDRLNVAADIPRPAACVASKDRCKCYTQQATILELPEETCRSIVAKGYFDDRQPPAQDKTQQGMPGLQQVPKPLSVKPARVIVDSPLT